MKISELDIISGLYGIVFEDLLSDDEVQKVHELAELYKDKFIQRGNILNNNLRLEEFRKSDIIWINNTSKSYWLYKKVSDAVRKINDETYGFELDGAQSFQYAIYKDTERGEYTWHNDIMSCSDVHVRKISVSILLSSPSDFRGGSFLFSPEGVPMEIEQEKGRMIVFPSWIPHCVSPVLRGTRISLVMWLYGKRFK
jgi:PKHD-type hydroxylase